MTIRFISLISTSAVCCLLLAGCGSSEDAYVVGNPSNVVIENPTTDENENDSVDGNQDDLVVEVKETELPDYWPEGFPLPQGAVIDNVIESDGTVTVTWVFESDSVAGSTSDFANALFDAGYEYGESQGSDEMGEGVYSNETHRVEFLITPLEAGLLQLYVVYGPAVE